MYFLLPFFGSRHYNLATIFNICPFLLTTKVNNVINLEDYLCIAAELLDFGLYVQSAMTRSTRMLSQAKTNPETVHVSIPFSGSIRSTSMIVASYGLQP